MKMTLKMILIGRTDIEKNEGEEMQGGLSVVCLRITSCFAVYAKFELEERRKAHLGVRLWSVHWLQSV